MSVKGDFNYEPVFEDPNAGKASLDDVLTYYRKGEYFLTGAPVQDASDNYYLQYLEGVEENRKKYLEGTLMGVFFPVLNNIFGVILFIRQPQLTAEAGLGQMLLIVFICCVCTFTTSVSLSALCSNGKMKTGGTYFLFSRALGAPLGTAIGFCFWFANSVAGAQYIIGCVETYILVGWPVFFDNAGEGFYNNIRVIGFFLWVILVSINLFGIKYVSQAGIVFLILVILGVIMVFIGLGVAKYDPKLETETSSGLNGLRAETCKDNWNS